MKIGILTSGGDAPGMNAAIRQLSGQPFIIKLMFTASIAVMQDCWIKISAIKRLFSRRYSAKGWYHFKNLQK